MARGPRLDAPGVLHHVMVRGIDGQTIFRDDRDREDLLQRLAKLVEENFLTVYAWALMSNHFHLLVRTADHSLEDAMRSLLTGFATVFNRRHGRVGHLFQNRYRSIVCEAERYFLELVRYIHLNPIRGGTVRDVDELEEYAYSGHSALLSTVPRHWQSVESVLVRFGRTRAWARAAYRKFVADGVLLGRRPELAGGGLIRSAGGWQAVKELRRGREDFKSDERILGGSEFVNSVLSEVCADPAPRPAAPPLSELKDLVCTSVGVSPSAIGGPGRRTLLIAAARQGLAFLWVEYFGRSGRDLALDLGLKPESIYRAAKSGRKHRDRWLHLINARPEEA